MGNAVLEARNGVHAFVICINGAIRFTHSQESLFEQLKIFGTFWPHAFIVYTNGGCMGKTDDEQKEKLAFWRSHKRCPPKLNNLFERVDNRHMIVECVFSKNNKAYHLQKSSEFLKLVEDIWLANQKECYTNELFKSTKLEYDKSVKDLDAALSSKDKEIQDLQQKLIAGPEYEKALTDMEAALSSKKKEMQDLEEKHKKALLDKDNIIAQRDEKIDKLKKKTGLRIGEKRIW